MTPSSTITTVIKSTLALALAGGVIGIGLGVVSPGYYRTLFAHGHDPSFDPVAVGSGLGLTSEPAFSGIALNPDFVWIDILRGRGADGRGSRTVTERRDADVRRTSRGRDDVRA